MFSRVLTTDHLALDKQRVCPLPGKTTVPPLSILLCERWGSCGVFSHSVCPLVSSLFSSHLGSHVGETLWVWLLTLLRDTVSHQTLHGPIILSDIYMTQVQASPPSLLSLGRCFDSQCSLRYLPRLLLPTSRAAHQPPPGLSQRPSLCSAHIFSSAGAWVSFVSRLRASHTCVWPPPAS